VLDRDIARLRGDEKGERHLTKQRRPAPKPLPKRRFGRILVPTDDSVL